MVGPAMMLLKMLHCKRMARKSSSTLRHRNLKDEKGPSNKPQFHGVEDVKIKKEKSDFGYEQICRVCLKQGYVPIFGSEDLSVDLNTFAGIEITVDDTYPKYLCHSCNSLLQGAILFRKTAQESDQFLKHPDDKETGVDSQNEDDWLDEVDNDYSDTEEKIMSKDNDKSTYYCKKCDITFETLDQYDEHRLSNEHDIVRRKCPICNKSYSYLYLKRHIMLHKMETPFMCDICGKKFSVNAQFNRHRITHFLDELPFKCQLCPYKGRFRESLKSHMKTHTGEKKHQCPQCPTRFFINKSNLNKHMLTHRTDYDFTCDQCQRGFFKKRDLDIHFKVDHSGIKDHVCNVCGKAFGYRKQMMKHQLTVHKREKGKGGRTPLYVILESKKRLEAEQQ